MLRTMTDDAVLDGGDGSSGISLGRLFAGEWSIDNEAGTATLDGTTALRWTGFSGFSWGRNRVRFQGTARSEYLSAVSVLEADMGEGDDFANVLYLPDVERGTLNGGPGSDRLHATAFDVDMRFDAAGEVAYSGEHARYRFSGFESLDAWSPVLTMVGTAGADELEAVGCEVLVEAGAGDDTVAVTGDDCRTRIAVRGGPGNDRLIGSGPGSRLYGEGGDDVLEAWYSLQGSGDRGNDVARGGSHDDDVRGGPRADLLLGHNGRDVLIGEQGRDTARGGPGRDVCRAELRTACEAR